MTNQRQQSFPSVLSALLSGDDVPVHLVYRLSDLEAEEFSQFVGGAVEQLHRSDS